MNRTSCSRFFHCALLPVLVMGLAACDQEEPLAPPPAYSFDVEDVTAVHVTHQGDDMSFTLGADASWFRHSLSHLHAHATAQGLTEHRHVTTDPVDDRDITEALRTLAGLEPEAVKDATRLETYGLDRPTLTIRLLVGAGEANALVLHFAARYTAQQVRYYLHTPGADHVLVVSDRQVTPVLEFLSRTTPLQHRHN